MKKTPKILIVSEIYPPEYSGAGLGAQFLAFNLYKRGMLYKVITRTKLKSIPEKDLFYIPENKFFRIGVFQNKLQKYDNKPFFKILFLLLDFPIVLIKTTLFFLKHKKSIDVFFFVSTKWISLILSILCVLFKKKYVIETTLIGHDDPIVNPNKNYVVFKKIIKNFQFKNASAINNISLLLANQCKKAGLSSEKIFTIPYSVDEKRFYTKTFEIKTALKKKLLGDDIDYPVILFAGVLIKRKGIDIVYNTFKLVLKKYPTAKLIFVGPRGISGQEKLQEKIQEDINIRGISKHIIFTGSVSNTEDYFNIADLFFFPSREEGFGRVFIEAMASGLPVLAKEIPGITDFIFTNKENGIVIDSEDENIYFKEIIEVLEKNEYRENIIKSAINKTKIYFSEETVINNYLKLFDFVTSDYKIS